MSIICIQIVTPVAFLVTLVKYEESVWMEVRGGGEGGIVYMPTDIL